MKEIEVSALILVAEGHSNKRIGYELGLSCPTVARILARFSAMFGTSGRVALVHAAHARLGRTAGALQSGTPEGGVLTNAEREVALLALEGLSNAAIAKQRGTRTRTVANQLASIYRKLGVGSRGELASRSKGVQVEFTERLSSHA